MTKQKRFEKAVRENDIETVKKLLKDSEVDPAAKDMYDVGNLAIRKASEYGHIEIVKLLLDDDRVDPAANNNYAIRLASENGHTEIVKLLLANKMVDPADYDNQAIGLASANGHVAVVRLLLDDERVNPADDYNAAIKLASANGHDSIVDMLYYDYRICHLQLALDIIDNTETYKHKVLKILIERLINDKDLQIFHPDNESLDGKITSLDLIKALYKAAEESKQIFIDCGFNQNLFTFISLLK